MSRVDIALATFNGEKYIKILLNSLLNQTYKNFIIHICDDGSTDDTLTICKNHPLYLNNQLIIHETNGNNGAYKNFRRVISHCESDYIFLCDQDDFWKPHKIEKMMKKIQEKGGNNSPVLVFSDLDLVDIDLNRLGLTFFEVTQKSLNAAYPIDFIFSNHIPGCSMLFNKKAKDSFLPMPEDFYFHDWWIAICTSFFGEIVYIQEPLIDYRQHDNNTVGTKTMMHNNIVQKIVGLRRIKSVLIGYEKIRQDFLSHIKYREKRFTLEHQKELLDIYYSRKSLNEKFLIYKKAKTGEDKLISLLVWMLM